MNFEVSLLWLAMYILASSMIASAIAVAKMKVK